MLFSIEYILADYYILFCFTQHPNNVIQIIIGLKNNNICMSKPQMKCKTKDLNEDLT